MKRTDLLDKTKEIISKDRTATHGEPEDNFATIANYWQEYLKSKGMIHPGGGFPFLTSFDVAAMMVLMKVSRIAKSPEHMDHWIDVAGYAACGGECASAEHKTQMPFIPQTGG